MRTLTAVWRRRHDEEGATIVIVVLSLIALFGMVVISVDVGGVLVERRNMVNTNDSAALAAAVAFANEDADCGVAEDPAVAAADDLATLNAAGSTRDSFDTDCVAQTVSVQYRRDQQLFFAPVLGFGNTANVNATATAMWGQAGGGNPVPIELNQQQTGECVYVDPADPGQGFKPPGDCERGYWFDPNSTDQNSAWGLLSLNEWAPDNGANDPFASCSAAGGSSDLEDWILQTDPLTVSLLESPTYVCTRNGASTSTWFDPLTQRVGDILLFPVNDPSQMAVMNPWLPGQVDVQNTNQEKYAIVAFAPMKVEAVLDGDDPAAIGTTGTAGPSGNCNSELLGPLDVLGQRDMTQMVQAECGAPATVNSIPYASLRVFTQGRGGTTFVKCPPVGGSNCDYRYDQTTRILTWVNPANQGIPNKRVDATWSAPGTAGTPGACSDNGIPPTSPPSRAFCLVLSWAGPQLIGTNPTPGTGFGANSVALVK